MTDPQRDQNRPGQGHTGDLRSDRYLAGRDLTQWSSSLGRRLAEGMYRLSTALGPHGALILILAFGAVIAAVMAALAAETYEAVAEAEGVAALDHPILNAMIGLRSPGLNSVVTAYTNIGGTIGLPLLAATIMVILAVRRRSWTPVIVISAAAAGSLAMTISGKNLIGRARPPLGDAVPPFESSASFPSGHTLNALVIAGVIAYLLILRRHALSARILIIILAGAFAVTIGLSRVYLGHHWFTDVLASWFLGTAWLAVVITAHRLYLTTHTRTAGQRTTPDPDGPPPPTSTG